MINNRNNTTGFVINLLTLILNFFACIISFIVLICIIYRQINGRIKRQERMILILYANIYVYLFLYVTIHITLNIHTILGDLYGRNFDSSLCIFRGYLITVLLSCLYNGFVIQAFFRLCRIVYSRHKMLQLFWFYIISAPIQLVVGFVLLCPLLIWHQLTYIPSEHYCLNPLSNLRGVLWIAFTTYGIPLICLFIMYIRITIFLRLRTRNRTIRVKRRQKRDFLIIKRIIIIMSLLLIVGLPRIILVIMMIITGKEHPLTYRIILSSGSVSMAGLSAGMAFTTRQLKRLVLRIWQRNRSEFTHSHLRVLMAIRSFPITNESLSLSQPIWTNSILDYK